MDIGLIHRFEKGYEEGAKSVNPNIKVIQNYVGVTDGAWNNPGKGKELSLAQIGKGADVIFTAAGNAGLGAFDAVEQAGKQNGRATHFVIGVDSNQNMVKPGFVLTSMVKRVDNAVYSSASIDGINWIPWDSASVGIGTFLAGPAVVSTFDADFLQCGFHRFQPGVLNDRLNLRHNVVKSCSASSRCRRVGSSSHFRPASTPTPPNNSPLLRAGRDPVLAPLPLLPKPAKTASL